MKELYYIMTAIYYIMTAIYDDIGSRYIPKQLDMHVITFK